MKNKKKDTHQFAFFVPSLTSILSSTDTSDLFISDEKLFHRMMRVVRMNFSDTCIFFDQKNNVHFELLGVEGKKSINGVVLRKDKNKILLPSITFFLPLIKREYFETALYSLVEIGVNVIQPIITKKTKRKWGGQKEYDRLFHIIVAAAEQSKNFSLPELKNPISLDEASKSLELGSEAKIFFDPSGDKISTVIDRYRDKNLILMVGPEGDLNEDEKKMIRKSGFYFCSLTSAVLRSLQAAALSIGIFRSFYSR